MSYYSLGPTWYCHKFLLTEQQQPMISHLSRTGGFKSENSLNLRYKRKIEQTVPLSVPRWLHPDDFFGCYIALQKVYSMCTLYIKILSRWYWKNTKKRKVSKHYTVSVQTVLKLLYDTWCLWRHLSCDKLMMCVLSPKIWTRLYIVITSNISSSYFSACTTKKSSGAIINSDKNLSSDWLNELNGISCHGKVHNL
jgi:hypothetical protein